MTCKDCVHEMLCLDNGTLFTRFTMTGQKAENVETNCPFKNFKNKADFVEVVRCKECKYSRKQDKVFGITDYKCVKHNISCLSPYDFCSYGERKND